MSDTVDLARRNEQLQEQLAQALRRNEDLERQLQHGQLNQHMKQRQESQIDVDDLQAQLHKLSCEKQRLAEEKTSLENALEAEQEYIMHKLHKQLLQLQGDKRSLMHEKQNLTKTVSGLAASVARLSQEKVDLEQAMEMEEEAFVNKLMRQLLDVMNSYKQMEKVLAEHGLTITRSDRQRRSTSRHASGDMDPRRSGSLSRSSFQRAFSNSLGSSPSASLPRRSLDPMQASRSFEEHPPTASAGRPSSALKQAQPRYVMREDSNSSLGSAMSIASRDVSVSRDSSAGAGNQFQAMHLSSTHSERSSHR